MRFLDKTKAHRHRSAEPALSRYDRIQRRPVAHWSVGDIAFVEATAFSEDLGDILDGIHTAMRRRGEGR